MADADLGLETSEFCNEFGYKGTEIYAWDKSFGANGTCAIPMKQALPITSFEAKKWLEVNFPSRGKVINFPSSHENSFFSSP